MQNKFSLLVVILLFSIKGISQNRSSEQFPTFPDCENKENATIESCFYNQIQKFVFENFKVPKSSLDVNFKGSVIVLFEVDSIGKFRVQYVDALTPELVAESKRVFAKLPKIKPATYNGRSTYERYTIKIAIPLVDPFVDPAKEPKVEDFVKNRNKKLNELDSIALKPYDHSIFKSQINIPFSHNNYTRFDEALNQVGSNNHTASKPYTYAEVAKYYDMKAANDKLSKGKTGWWGRKFFDENMVEIQGENYWFTINPIADLRLGKTNEKMQNSTFQNTRGVQIQGALGKELVFTTTIFESQGRFAGYFNEYANSIRPAGGDPAIIPGIGIAKQFKTDAYDFPSADASLTYTPSKFINLQFAYSRNFLGDGYRSLLMGDGASPHPFLKINTNFWKIKYTNTYMWLKDVRQEVVTDRTYATKFMSNHYLSINVTNRLNIGFFESVIWTNDNARGFDINFINPIVFYRTVEFASSARSGNAVLGLTGKYKINNQINVYSQFILDEFSLSDIKAQDKSWKNKYGYQIGAKYYNALGVKDLYLQVEYNRIRPYVYSHSDPKTNYGHNNQNMGHNWGGNFEELIAIARYNRGRLYADVKFIYGVRGLDFDTTTDQFNYGGNIYKNYNNDRPFDKNVLVGQGNTTKILIGEVQAGYLINPATNLKLFGSYLYRSFNPKFDTTTVFAQNTSWFSIGFRTDIFNLYQDF
jgi:hypothetical protein